MIHHDIEGQGESSRKRDSIKRAETLLRSGEGGEFLSFASGKPNVPSHCLKATALWYHYINNFFHIVRTFTFSVSEVRFAIVFNLRSPPILRPFLVPPSSFICSHFTLSYVLSYSTSVADYHFLFVSALPATSETKILSLPRPACSPLPPRSMSFSHTVDHTLRSLSLSVEPK